MFPAHLGRTLVYNSNFYIPSKHAIELCSYFLLAGRFLNVAFVFQKNYNFPPFVVQISNYWHCCDVYVCAQVSSYFIMSYHILLYLIALMAFFKVILNQHYYWTQNLIPSPIQCKKNQVQVRFQQKNWVQSIRRIYSCGFIRLFHRQNLDFF